MLDNLTTTQEFTQLASDETVKQTAQALEAHGIHTLIAVTSQEARFFVLDLIPNMAKVYNPPSRTLEEIGLDNDILASTRFQAVRLHLQRLDRNTQQAEVRQLVTTPDVVVGSVHAITENGEAVIASASGSQLASAAAGAGEVIWVAGTQKIVPSMEEAFRRVREYCLPLEDERTRRIYGRPSAINKMLIVNGEVPGRITMILVKQNLGF